MPNYPISWCLIINDTAINNCQWKFCIRLHVSIRLNKSYNKKGVVLLVILSQCSYHWQFEFELICLTCTLCFVLATIWKLLLFKRLGNLSYFVFVFHYQQNVCHILFSFQKRWGLPWDLMWLSFLCRDPETGMWIIYSHSTSYMQRKRLYAAWKLDCHGNAISITKTHSNKKNERRFM